MSKRIRFDGRDGAFYVQIDTFWDGVDKIVNLNDMVEFTWSATEGTNEEEAQEGFELIQRANEEDYWKLCGYIQPEGTQHNAFLWFGTYAKMETYPGSGEYIAYNGGGFNFNGKVVANGVEHTFDGLGTTQYNGILPMYITMYGGNNSEIHLNLPFPVFDTEAHLQDYIINGNLNGCLNADNEFGEDTQPYYIYTRYASATVKNGSITYAQQNTGFFERILCNGRIVLYKTGEPNQYEIRGNGIVASAFSSINQYTVEQIDPADYSDGLLRSGPVYQNYSKEWGDGTFTLGLYDLQVTSISNIPFADNPQKAQDYLDGLIPLEEMDNYSYISGGAGIDRNPTGEPEEETTLSLNLSRGVFAADYTMSRNGLVSLATDFFSSNFWDDIKNGLKYYNNNYMSAVSSCIYFPFDISSIFDLVAVNYVGFGSYQHDVSNYGISRVAFNKGVKDLGETFIRPTFNNFLDFAAVEIYLFLPYIGFVQLQTDKYMGKTLKIQYSIDIHSGECSAMLFANGTLMDTYDGQIGIVNPITAEDLAGYAQAQISGIKSALGSVAGGGISGAMAGAKGGAYGAAAGAIVGSGLGAVNAGLTAYGLMNMKPQLFSSGGYSGALGANLPQYAFLVFAIHETEEPANLIQTHGKPSNRSGLIGDFSGFLSVNSVNLNCGDATEAEKAEILQLLYSGIII